MMAEPGAIHVQGLLELSRAFRRADATLSKELRKDLRDAAEPIRLRAQALAVEEIPRIGIPWSRMRVGVTQKLVYVVPQQHGTKRQQNKRPNLVDLLLDRAMNPAFVENIDRVIQAIDEVLATVGSAWERAA
jgi:hypothetical protein